MDNDLSKCPKCGGPADNGHDRCVPPNPYTCKTCSDSVRVESISNKVKHHRRLNYDLLFTLSLAKEAIDLRKQRYIAEEKVSNLATILSKEWCCKTYLHNEPIPTECRGMPADECHECWMKELGF